MAAGAALSIGGFLGYYLPLYGLSHRLPSTLVSLPLLGTVSVRWAELAWCLALTAAELGLLTALNMCGVHAIAVATGFTDPGGGRFRRNALLGLGLERKHTGVLRYGINPFQGLHPAALFLFNVALRFRGFVGNQIVRFLVRLLLGRYAVRAVLDFAGLPLYMTINALSVRTVLREARVVLVGQRALRRLLDALPVVTLASADRTLLYDTLQFIAVSKGDFHRNHLLLTRDLMARFGIVREPEHPLPGDYLDRLGASVDGTLALCQMVIVLGFVLDGRLSRRERRRLAELNARGLLAESPAELSGRARAFVDGQDIGAWLGPYLARMQDGAQVGSPIAVAGGSPVAS